MSSADYFGLEVIDRSDLTICNDPPLNLDVCEVYVVFDNPGDKLISVAFSNVSTTDPAGFYQHTFGSDTAPGCNLIALFPTLVCDSFVTVGAECDADGSSTDPDFDSTGFNNSGKVNGGWFNSSPANGQGAPDSNGRVMIARVSYKQNKNTSGDVCVFAKLAGSDDITTFLLQPFDCSVPGGGLPGPSCPGVETCYDGHRTPGCDCAPCCEVVCGIDPFCCDGAGAEWCFGCADLACMNCNTRACQDCDNDGTNNDVAIAEGISADCNANGIPDECEIDENTLPLETYHCVAEACDTICDECQGGPPGCNPLCVITCDPDCNANGIPDACEDCNGNGVADECDIDDETSPDCNSNGIPDECEKDCNENGVPDDCDISSGTSPDCNSNGIPDECDEDCNDNSIPDDCDITNGTSADIDSDGVPDECQADCNFNGIFDLCDVTCVGPCQIPGCGGSVDCDGNSIPDECEVVLRGPMFLSGHDADFLPLHCWNTPGVCGDLYGQLLWYAVKHSQVESAGPGGERKLLAIGVNGTTTHAFDALAWFNNTLHSGPGAAITFVTDPAVIEDPIALDFNDFSAIYIPSVDLITQGGITSDQLQKLNTRQAHIQDFVEVQKGGLLALTEFGSDDAYGWLPVALETQAETITDACPTDTLNLILSNAVTCDDLTPSGPYHNFFVGPEGFLGLKVLADSLSGQPLILGEVRSILGADCNENEVPDSCDIADETSEDCQPNEIPDECDIASGSSDDDNADGIPDECEECGTCPTDVNGDGNTGPLDLATLLGAWGPTGPGNCLDANGDLVIGPLDLATLLGAWGPCP